MTTNSYLDASNIATTQPRHPTTPSDEADMSNNDRNYDGNTSLAAAAWAPRGQVHFVFPTFFIHHYLKTVRGNSGDGISSSRGPRVRTLIVVRGADDISQEEQESVRCYM